MIKKGNKVKILSGKDRTKEGEVMEDSKWYKYKLNS